MAAQKAKENMIRAYKNTAKICLNVKIHVGYVITKKIDSMNCHIQIFRILSCTLFIFSGPFIDNTEGEFKFGSFTYRFRYFDS